jgi:methylmalonyl-CoA/ethylmalonyl-CoA epimerase
MDIGKMNLADATVTQLLIPIDDFERGVAFYRDVLGLPFLFGAPPQMAFFQCGAVRLLVGVTPAGQKVQGVEFKAPPHVVSRSATSEVWLAEFVDPDGNQLALMSEAPLK